jgi:DNA-binding beta-propeller fold protein YncE
VVYYSNVFLALICLFVTAISSAAVHEELIVVEQSAGSVGFYDALDGKKLGDVQVGFLPHEVTVSKDQKTAYVSNFGLQDYDETIGVPGVSISVIDIPNRTEKYRLYTFDNSQSAEFSEIDKAPHGVKLRPPEEKQLYVNVEKGNKILVFDVDSKKIIKELSADARTHNLIFSPDGKILWLIAGLNGILRLDADTGKTTGQFKLSTPIRGLSYVDNGRLLMLSGANEIVLLNPNDLTIAKRFGNLGIGQLLYSAMTPNGKLIVAPASLDSQAIIIDTATGKVIKHIVTGLDPVTVAISADGNDAFVTNARSDYVTQIDLHSFAAKNIRTSNGPNGLAITKMSQSAPHKILQLGAPLPLSGKDGAEGREMMLGYEFWQASVKQAGGLVINNSVYDVNIIYVDTHSDAAQLKKITQELIQKNKVDILLGTYGEKLYDDEIKISRQNHIPIAPLITKKLNWQPNDIVNGNDLFVTTKAFAEKFETYYNSKASELAAVAMASTLALQYSLLKTNSIEFDSLSKAFAEAHFHTFLKCGH